MAKIVKDDWEFKVETINGEVRCSAHYGVESEGIEQRRGMPVNLTSQEEATVLAFVTKVVFPKVKERERIL